MNLNDINREAWDKRTLVHVDSKFYDVPGFLAGACSLREIEVAALGEVAGETLLHLQCHFGLDTLSWARRGAIVTGVDFSPVAIERAERLRDECGLAASFVCSDVYDYETDAPFDVVFTSYGTIIWLSDLDEWAGVIARSLKPGGRFLFVDFHPARELLSGFPYFHEIDPIVEEEGTYTENCDGETSPMATWVHSIGETLNALIEAGIRIDRVDEFPFSPFACFEGLEEREPGRFFQQHEGNDVPMTFAIHGTRVAAR